MKVKETALSYQTHRKIYTYRDYLDLPEEGKRYEIINGELIMAPAPRIIHQEVGLRLKMRFFNFNQKKQYGKIFDSPIDVKLSETNLVQPDILYVAKERFSIIKETHINGAPDLIVEILSPSTAEYDLLDKKEIYAQFGVQEYWLVDPTKQWIEVYLNRNNRFELKQRVENQGIAESQVLPGLKVKLEEIFHS
jgi:Uma2 family endonuclease